MLNRQNHKFNRLVLIRKFLADNLPTFSGFTPLTDQIVIYNSILTKIDGAHLRQLRNNKGIAVSKKKARKEMAKVVVRHAAKARVWARTSGKIALIPVFKVSHRALLNGRDINAVIQARNTVKALSDNLASLAPYNITPANITAINDSIAAFEDLIPRPIAARQTSSVATESLPGLFKQAAESLRSITDLLVNEYSDSHPDLVRMFTIEHRFGKAHVRHTGITAHITDAATSQNIRDAELKIVKLEKTSTSDINGITPIIRCVLGKYQIQITSPGYRTFKKVEKIKRGHITHLEVQLQKS